MAISQCYVDLQIDNCQLLPSLHGLFEQDVEKSRIKYDALT